MGSQVQGILLIKANSAEQAGRILYNLNTETRSDFAEDLPESEVKWFDVFDVMEQPDFIKTVDANYIAVGFFQDEEDYSSEMHEFSEGLINRVGVSLVVLCEFNADAGVYIWNYTPKQQVKRLWADDDGEIDTHPSLKKQINKRLTDTFYYENLDVDDNNKNVSALHYLAKEEKFGHP